MRKKEKIQEILKRLDQEYGTDCVCYLDHENAWQLQVPDGTAWRRSS